MVPNMTKDSQLSKKNSKNGELMRGRYAPYLWSFGVVVVVVVCSVASELLLRPPVSALLPLNFL